MPKSSRGSSPEIEPSILEISAVLRDMSVLPHPVSERKGASVAHHLAAILQTFADLVSSLAARSAITSRRCEERRDHSNRFRRTSNLSKQAGAVSGRPYAPGRR